MESTLMTMKRGTVLCVAAALMAASGAVAQPGNFDQPLGGDRGSGAGGNAARGGISGGGRTTSQMNLMSIEGDQRYEVTVRDGEVSAKVNGREVPAERIRRQDGRIEILDARGNVLKSFQATFDFDGERQAIPAPPPPRVPGARGRALIAPEGAMPPAAPALPGVVVPQGPRVMIGITMGEVPEALAEHLSLEPGTAVMIDRVLEGLPAEKAGLRARDVVVEVNGQSPVTEQKLREEIRKTEPGKMLELTVLRRGQEERVSIAVERVEAERIATFRGPEAPGAAPQALEDAEKRMAEAERMMRERLEAFEGRLGPDIRQRFGARGLGGVGPEGFELFVPMGPGDQSQLRDRVSQLDERMVDLERQMERLAERMDELRRALERREQRRE
jgi:sulfur carrier protein ThiS